eukprot:GEMP01017362.1.p1 GENE.GEMP01017362.1~~GEMP01017362.1.p1  ORF type:complete len:852 (+),score=230.78 GEMP01017362.1:78-2633(+)
MLTGLKFEKHVKEKKRKKDKEKKKKEEKKKKKKKTERESSSSSSDKSEPDATQRGRSPLVLHNRPSASSKSPSDELTNCLDSICKEKSPKVEFADPDKPQVFAKELNPQCHGESVAETKVGSRIPAHLLATTGSSVWLQRKRKRQQELAAGKLDLSTPLPLKNNLDRQKQEETMTKVQLERMSGMYQRNKKILDRCQAKGGSSNGDNAPSARKLTLEELIALENEEADSGPEIEGQKATTTAGNDRCLPGRDVERRGDERDNRRDVERRGDERDNRRDVERRGDERDCRRDEEVQRRDSGVRDDGRSNRDKDGRGGWRERRLTRDVREDEGYKERDEGCGGRREKHGRRDVGDNARGKDEGLARWRERKRQREDDGGKERRHEGTHSRGNDRRVERRMADDSSDDDDALQKMHQKHVKKDEVKQSIAKDYEKREDDTTGLDANELSARAMEAMFAGDMGTYNKLIARINDAPIKGSANSKKFEQKAFEEIDAAGRSRELMEKVQTKSTRDLGKLAKQTMTRDKDGVAKYFQNDECTLQELALRERVEGIQDYDANYREHIYSKGAKYRTRNDDEDVEYTLGDYEKKQQPRERKRGQDPKEFARRQKETEVNDAKRMHQSANKCNKCMDSDKFNRRRDIISESPTVYLCFERTNEALAKWQLLIVPKSHCQSISEVEENCAAEIRNFQKTLVQAFEQRDLAPVFIETAAHLVDRWKLYAGDGNHTAIEVIPVPIDKTSDAIIYTQKSLQEAEEWTSHKKVIDCPKGIREKVPPGFAYLHMDISLQRGFAHVIEDPRLFPKGYARSILHDVLEADRFTKAYASHEERDAEKAKFAKLYEPLDWTAQLQSGSAI